MMVIMSSCISFLIAEGLMCIKVDMFLEVIMVFPMPKSVRLINECRIYVISNGMSGGR